ncbi:hypothetical protein CSE16_08400 [Solibacillus sp. R5-41]|uniref:hypothetical protein n=1 Tax=Solibacillus sp. R5-41 TaxID=2048654 RepID=UPI000C125EB2|nr:hypothetical protein [Solibacillus sp. R5-41]ATP40068.1 hypothetical protein CSE16_08400 [Solibacillus sp. R5-41]
MIKKSPNSLVVLLITYTIAIIYFMFLGFDRPQISNSVQEYNFSIIPTSIPLWYPITIFPNGRLGPFEILAALKPPLVE